MIDTGGSGSLDDTADAFLIEEMIDDFEPEGMGRQKVYLEGFAGWVDHEDR
jgi:hypothetical protein